MNDCIIYKTDEGTIALVIPTPEALKVMTLEQIAIKDVPTGKAFKICDSAELPDMKLFDRWYIADELLTDGFGG